MRIQIIHRATVALLMCLSVKAHAVHLSDTGGGDALIVPLWSVEAGNDTLITVRNESEWAVAVKLRVIDESGIELAAFNLYLNDDDTWAGALTASGGETRVVTGDGSCLLSADEFPDSTPGVVVPPPDPTAGYLELIEMARLPKVNLGASVITPWPACDELAERFRTGDWATDPTADLTAPDRDLGRISARVQIIDVADGGMISLPAMALEGFSDIVQHTPPDSPVPNLSTAHGEDTDSGITESRVCTGSECRILTWASPVEAVASVLLTNALRGDIVLNPAIGGLTELVVTRPLKRYESNDETGFAIASAPDFVLFDREGAFIESQLQTVQLTPPQPPKTSPIPVSELETDKAVAVVSFNRPAGEGQRFQSPILGIFASSAFSTEATGFISGHAEIFFSQSADQRLTSLEGESLRGEAAIGIAVQQFTNGTLLPDPATQTSVLSNYRTAELMTRR